jgi:hypothetical protein
MSFEDRIIQKDFEHTWKFVGKRDILPFHFLLSCFNPAEILKQIGSQLNARVVNQMQTCTCCLLTSYQRKAKHDFALFPQNQNQE